MLYSKEKLILYISKTADKKAKQQIKEIKQQILIEMERKACRVRKEETKY